MPPPSAGTLAASFPREDLVRLLTQCIHSLGYEKAADALEQESGIPLRSETITRFRAGILEGRWDEVEQLIEQLPIRTDTDYGALDFLQVRV